MKPWEIRLQHAANWLAIVTGVLFGWFKYFPPTPANPDPYSAAMSPWEPRFHDAHVLAVPLLVYACGVIWRSHIAPKWAARASRSLTAGKRWSGLALLFVLVPMVATGYLIQVAVDEFWRKSWVAIHLVTSVAWSLSYVAHWFATHRPSKRRGR